jgi:hypothetical protein
MWILLALAITMPVFGGIVLLRTRLGGKALLDSDAPYIGPGQRPRPPIFEHPGPSRSAVETQK